MNSANSAPAAAAGGHDAEQHGLCPSVVVEVPGEHRVTISGPAAGMRDGRSGVDLYADLVAAPAEAANPRAAELARQCERAQTDSSPSSSH